jgi:hypothetical protein
MLDGLELEADEVVDLAFAGAVRGDPVLGIDRDLGLIVTWRVISIGEPDKIRLQAGNAFATESDARGGHREACSSRSPASHTG